MSCSRAAVRKALRCDVWRSSPRILRLSSAFPLNVAPPGGRGNSPHFILRLHRNFTTAPFRQEQISERQIRATEVLPVCCPGCGAFSQTVWPDEPGYYNPSRKQTRKLLAAQSRPLDGQDADGPAEYIPSESETSEEQAVPTPIHGRTSLFTLSLDSTLIKNIDEILVNETDILNETDTLKRTSHICDRCHDLTHHNKAVTTPKPSILAIREFLDESPHKHNRIYHILDAADFPMSLVPRIHRALAAQEQRGLNRRASTEKYLRGRKLPTVSFIITRSDLLAAKKEQVDSKMQYVRSVLRSALGRAAKDVRLGNVHMISAHRGWWTKEVKEEIREHGGGVWVVGKANVGKSSFIEACFPKDSKSLENMDEWMEHHRDGVSTQLDSDSLLPPVPAEDQYPVLPVVSSLPGTTVSPIRIPFGRGRGEMIDLPGLERGELEDHVRDEHKRDLIMTKRIKPERCTIKPGQSLLLGGGLVRLTTVNPEDTMLAACFVPIESHITKTDKAIEMQTEQRTYPGTVLMKEGTGSSISSAGVFDLEWDVTNSNLPTTLAKAVKDRGVTPGRLPYRVMSADILIEGCGWIEVSVQVRAKPNPENDSQPFPQVEVFSPNGQNIGIRPPMECWEFIAEKHKADRRKRPRLVRRPSGTH
ncbi:hypothetical protein N7474_006450 [Penicillium riverlandense]|uniref:uncharacterized protein n=1 Tax=Penicillium riverlandense TaxID=1903569 RepID=UPI0025483489|nr:uncharacterized protein N7474_006450 [Penicillium riverlandense]KAJ5814673.1 hypothetical protein N7474_006450 [Penicillium riverlandense]